MSSYLSSLKRLTPYAPIAIAAIAGLVLGLLIGWVWWPVQWTNAWVTDLAPAQQAAYISAVADTYVVDGSQNSTQRMQERLAPFGDNLPTAVTAAMEYYQNDPNADAVIVGNIGRLATDLGIPVDASMMAAEAAEGQEAPPAAGSEIIEVAPANAPAPAEDEEGTGILTWVLAVLASLALVGGGIYLLLRLRNRELAESLTSPAPATPLPASRNEGAAQESATARSSAWGATRRPAPDNELSFEEEEDEEPAVRFGSGVVDDFDLPEPDEDEEADLEIPSRYSSARSVGAPEAEIERHTAAYEPPAIDARGPAVSDDEPPADLDSLAARSYNGDAVKSLDTGRRASARTAEAVAPVQAPAMPRSAPIASYAFQFHAGMPDYIEAQNINDPATGRYLGEFGMCVSSKNRVLHSNPDQVIALEVWIYDKKDPRDNLNTTSVLLSEYAADRDFDQAFTRERDGTVKTLVAQPQARFQLDGPNLVMEGEVVDVAYDRDGIYRSATVELSIYARN